MGTTTDRGAGEQKRSDTGGLVSAYQVLDFTAQRIEAHNLSITNAEKIPIILVPAPYPEELREKESEKKSTRIISSKETKGALQLATELSAWDEASDEALMIFEAKLD
jgi:hypothetical protein